MELITLLNEQDWSGTKKSISLSEIEQAKSGRVSQNVKRLYNSYIRGLLLNLGFLIFFVFVYGFNPEPQFLLPVILIASVFLFILSNLGYQLISNRRVDTSQDLKTVLEQSLSLNKKIFTRQCRYQSWLFTLSFIGGFFLGLAFQGWDFDKYQEKPIIFLILSLLTFAFYKLTKSKGFAGLNKWLNPSYYEAKQYLEKQLVLLKDEEDKEL